VSTVQYVGLVTLASIWAVVSVLFMLDSAELGVRTAAWIFAASFAAASLVAAYGLVQLLRHIFGCALIPLRAVLACPALVYDRFVI
jgi:hypothetical protein